MFEYLDIVYRKNSNTNVNIHISYDGSSVFYKYFINNIGEYVTGSLSVDRSEDWVKELYNIHIEDWEIPESEIHVNGEIREEYMNEWYIEYKDDHKEPVFFKIGLEKPDNFSDFVDLIDIIYPIVNPLRVERIFLKFISSKSSKKVNSRDYARATEKFSIKRYDGTFSHSIEYDDVIAADYKVTSKLNVRKLLDIISEKEIFVNPYEDPNKTENIDESLPLYEMEIEQRNGNIIKYSGIYDHSGLPTDWIYFINIVKNFMAFHIFSEVCQKNNYNSGRARPGEYIFVMVKFSENGKNYSYLTDLTDIHAGDFVVVPAGEKDTLRIALVSDIFYADENNLPYPLEDTKNIVKKFQIDDFFSLGSVSDLENFNRQRLVDYFNGLDNL